MRTVAVSVLVLGFLVSFTNGDEGKETKPKLRFTIGKETTYVTRPVDEDGYPDYAVALNERLGKGIKPKDNANALLWKAFGPSPEGMKMPPEFFKRLGIEAPPERGDYFIGLTPFLGKHLKGVDRPAERQIAIARQLEERATKRTWTRKEYPEIAAWLKANEKPLALVVEATKRPQYFNPLVPEKTDKWPKGLFWVRLPVVSLSHELADALTARAMLHVAEGRPDAAWRDLLACHRLGRLIARGNPLIEAERGMAIDRLAGWADLAYLDGSKQTAKQLQACLSDLQKLSPVPDVAETVNLGERFLLLDFITVAVRRGVINLREFDGAPRSRPPDPYDWRLSEDIDWEPALRNTNRWYDRVVAAMRAKDRHSRKEQLDQLWKEHFDLKDPVIKAGGYWTAIRQSKNSAKGKLIGDILMSMRFPGLFRGANAKDMTEQVQANLRIAFALAWYQREHDHYPKTLDALAPKYLTTIPGDLFSGKSLIYRPAANGYLLYSVGVNGEDEEGRSLSEEGSDDIAVRMPLPKLPPRE